MYPNTKGGDIMESERTIYVDVDGTLLGSGLDDAFKAKIDEIGIKEAISWYDNVTVDNLPINFELMEEIKALRAQGWHFVIYTNRGSKQVGMTRDNLGAYWHLFDTAIFTEGKKSKMFADYELWDNEARYADKCKSFRLIEFASAP